MQINIDNILFVDTETTGVTAKRIIELAWVLTDAKGYILKQVCLLIKPDGWVVPNRDFYIKHGFSQEKNEALGVPLERVMDLFLEDYATADVIVAHNIVYDKDVIENELIRLNYKPLEKKFNACTMKLARQSGLFNRMPSLENLYIKLFKAELHGAHGALYDALGVKECFFEMLRLNLMKLC